jgi:hypothetical protein
MQGNLTRYVDDELASGHVEQLSAHYPQEEVARRFERLEEWLGRYHKTNHDGTVLTPALTQFLSQEADFEALLDDLSRLRDETRNGRFQLRNILQRDLEFRRFEYEYTRILEPLTYQLGGRYPPPLSTLELYQLFDALEALPDQVDEPCRLDERQHAEAQRAAFEAAGLLDFLKDFRSRTARQILVIGNDRFGRQWFVEPIEEYLRDGFWVEYHRVRSGTSTRMSIPSPLPQATVARLNREMPHVVVVDGCHAPARNDVIPLSRGLRAYGHWFVVFNDLRCAGETAKYRGETGFPEHYLQALTRWHEFAAAREFIEPWVSSGLPYRITSWGPELKDTVQMGDEPMPRYPTTLGGDRPLVILANPIIYRTEGNDLPAALRGTTPRYFDDPEQHVADEVLFSFGPFGLETRRKGVSTERFVRTVQQQIKAELKRIL